MSKEESNKVILSPKLFIALFENIFEKIDWTTKSIKINESYLNHLRFADDVVLLAEASKNLQETLYSLEQASPKVGLELNVKQTKIMTNNNKKSITITCTTGYVSTYPVVHVILMVFL